MGTRSTRRSEFIYPLAIAISLPLLLIGSQRGHNVQYNLPWSRGFAEQLFSGILYPRWLPDQNSGAGSPVFFYYAPLPFYIMSLGFPLCYECRATIQLGIGELLLIIPSGISFYIFARPYAQHIPSTVAAILYALMPYHFAVDLLERQALGEVMAYVWMPLILYFVDRMFAGMAAITGLSLSYFCLVVSHLPAAVIFSMFLPIYVGVYAFGSGSRRVLLQFVVSILIGVGLSGIYIIPALLSLQYIQSDWLTSSFYQYDKWFMTHWPAEFWSDRRRLLLMQIITTSGLIILWSIVWQCNRNSTVRKRLIIWLLFARGAWFLMTPLSRIICKVIPFLQMIQFPWRITVVLDLAISGTVVVAMRCVTIAKKWTSLLSVLIVGALLMLSMEINTRRFVEYWWISRSDEEQENLAAYVRSGCDATAFIPVGVKVTEDSAGCAQIDHIVGTSRVAFDPANGEVKELLWRPREIILDVDFLRETDLVVHQLMFPGWRASITGSNTSLKIVQNRSTGLLEVTAPPGHYQLVLKLEALWQEVVGAILSGVSWLVIIIHEVLRKVRGA
jgi:hypothetical protein